MKALWIPVLVAACTRPAEERALQELEVGRAAAGSTAIEVVDGLATVRALEDGAVELWCNAPAIAFTLTGDGGALVVTARNVLGDATLAVDGVELARVPADDLPATAARFVVPGLAPGGHAFRLAPPDADLPGPFRVAAMADIQTALPTVDEVFAVIAATPDVRFVVAMGDITERGTVDEYDLFERQLLALPVPFYTTLGNHELWGPPERWFGRYGRASFQFSWRGVAFTFVDSGDAGLDPLVEEWLDGWLLAARDRPHVFLTHIPPIDPVGARYGGFRSSRDGYRLLERLAAGGVDLTLYGHIHTSIVFENAGIPAFISGGGGAQPMRGDGIDRHFLTVDFDGEGHQRVSVVRVDP